MLRKWLWECGTVWICKNICIVLEQKCCEFVFPEVTFMFSYRPHHLFFAVSYLLLWQDQFEGKVPFDLHFVKGSCPSWPEKPGDEYLTAVHTASTGAWIAVSCWLSLGPQCQVSVLVFLAYWISWKCPYKHNLRCFHGDSKSMQVDNED